MVVMVSLSHHTVGKWAFQRLILQCASNSGKMEEYDSKRHQVL